MASNRQNKKRKGRNVNNRERTVTTLTEDPANGTFLVPSLSQDTPIAPAHSSMQHFRSSAFNSTTANNSFNLGSMQAQAQPDIHLQFYPQAGQNDLEVLEKLKETIKKGQHEFFRTVPQPSALARVYLGSSSSPYNASMSNVPPHPEQVPSSQTGAAYNLSSSVSAAPSGNSDFPRRGRNQSMSMDSWDTLGPRKSLPSPSQISPPQPQANRYENSKSYPPSGPSAASKSQDSKPVNSTRDAPSDRNSLYRLPVQPAASRLDQQGRLGGDSAYPPKSSAVDTKDGKDDLRQRDSWTQRHGQIHGQTPQDDRSSRTPAADPSDRSPTHRTGSLDAGRPSDRGLYDRDKERERERERDGPRDRSRDRDTRRYDRYDRRLDDRPRIIDNRRPPPDQRHWEPTSRRGELGNPIDRRVEADRSDDRQSRSVDDHRPARVSESATDDRRAAPSVSTSGDTRRPPPLGPSSTVDDRNGRSTAAAEDSVARNTGEDRVTRQPPPGPKEERKPLPLEDRIGRPPSLQDRLQPANETRAPNNRLPPTGPSLEERLSHPIDDGRAGRTADDHHSSSRPPAPIDRTRPTDDSRSTANADLVRPPMESPSSHPLSAERGRTVERFAPPTAPVEDRNKTSSLPPARASVYSRAPSVARDEVSVRDYRGGASGVPRAVSVSREPVELRASSYRSPADDRYLGDSRRPETIDVDRYTDSRPSYRRTPPPPPMQQPERGVWERPSRWPPSPPPRGDPYAEEVRFRTNAAYQQGPQWAEYDSRSRGWEEKDHRQWEQNETWSADRRFIERDPVPSGGWETRQEREQREQREREQRRASYPPPPPVTERTYDSRPLSSRLTDSYSTVPSSIEDRDRGYASEIDSGIYAPPPPSSLGTGIGIAPEANSPPFVSRIRQRSPSPIGASSGARDLSMVRPPMKRAREDYPPPPLSAGAVDDYYSPHAPGAVAPPPRPSSTSGTGEYQARMGSPVTGASGYYDRSGSYGVGSGGREYGPPSAQTAPRDGFQAPQASVGSYDRRMPPPGTSRASPLPYSSQSQAPPPAASRGSYARDDRRYG